MTQGRVRPVAGQLTDFLLTEAKKVLTIGRAVRGQLNSSQIEFRGRQNDEGLRPIMQRSRPDTKMKLRNLDPIVPGG